MELYIIIIAVIVAVGILISFIMNAKSAKTNINGIIIMALAGVCAILFMLFGFRFSSFAVYLLFIVMVAVLLLMVFLLMQYVRHKKEKSVRAYANGNAGSTARKLGVVKAREILADEIPPQKISLQEHFVKNGAREIPSAPLFDIAEDTGVGEQDIPEEENADESQTMQAEMATIEPYEAGIAGIVDAADELVILYEQSAENDAEIKSAEDLPVAVTEDIDAESLQETPEIGGLDQEESAAQPFEFGMIQQDMEAPEDVQEEPEEAETESAQVSVILPADEIAVKAAAEEIPEQSETVQAEIEELPEIGEELLADADSKPYEMLQEEIQPEELPEIGEELSADADSEPYEMLQEEIQPEELPEIGEELSADADSEPYEMLQEEEIRTEDLRTEEEPVMTADAELKPSEAEEENTSAETILVPEETEKEKSILHKAAGLKEEGKYLVACSLFRSAAQNAQNVQNIKYAEFQMLDCLVLAGQTEDAARVMFGILNKKYDLTAGEKLVLKETMTNLHNADRQKTV